jgi:hypothetical protein
MGGIASVYNAWGGKGIGLGGNREAWDSYSLSFLSSLAQQKTGL